MKNCVEFTYHLSAIYVIVLCSFSTFIFQTLKTEACILVCRSVNDNDMLAVLP